MYLELTYTQVAIAGLLILINGLLSLWLRLGLERSLLIASVRSVGQLLLIGLVLEWVFQIERWQIVLVVLCMMTLIAGWTAASRSERRYPGLYFNTIISIWASSWLVTAFAMFVILRDLDHWYQPQYIIPMLGMVLGNTLNGISLGLNHFTSAMYNERSAVETALALGATRWEAAKAPIQEAIRTGMIPITNAMMVVGLVSLPGMMTGQIMAGAAPIEAVKYQIVILFLIAAATALGTGGIVALSYRRLFNSDHQFMSHLVTKK